jgi:hypothetical protein
VEASAEVRHAVDSSAARATVGEEAGQTVHEVMQDSLLETFRLMMLIAAGLAFAGAISAALIIRKAERDLIGSRG